MNPDQVSDEEIAALGLRQDRSAAARYKIGDQAGELRKIEVHSVRPVRRVGPDGNIRSDLVVEITQTFRPTQCPGARFRGGCTLLIDLATAEVRYMVRKKVEESGRALSAQIAVRRRRQRRAAWQLLRRRSRRARALRADASRARIGERLWPHGSKKAGKPAATSQREVDCGREAARHAGSLPRQDQDVPAGTRRLLPDFAAAHRRRTGRSTS